MTARRLRTFAVIALLLLTGAACSNSDDATTDGTEADGGDAAAEADGGSAGEDDGAEGETGSGDEQSGGADGGKISVSAAGDPLDPPAAAPGDVDVPDPCAALQTSQGALEEVAGPIDEFDGPDERREDFMSPDGSEYQQLTCRALGERFKVQVILQPAAIGFALQDEREIDGVGDAAKVGKANTNPDADVQVVFRVGDVSGLVSLLFAGGDLTSAPEPTEDDVVTAATAIAAAVSAGV